MIKKIIGILACSLLITVTISPVTGINNNENATKNQIGETSESQVRGTSIDEDWPQFQRDAQNTGYSTSRAPQTNRLLWSWKSPYFIGSSPVVTDGRVYIGTEAHFLFCRDAHTGKRYWEFPIDGSTSISVCAVYDGKVYIPRNYGQIHCLDAENGSEIWNFSTGSSISSVTAADDKVYFGNTNKMYCLKADTGDVLWDYSIGLSRSCPAFSDDKLYFSSYDGKLYCLDANNGSKIWDFFTDVNYPTSPTVADGKVYSGGGDGFYCLDASNGSKLWVNPTVVAGSSPSIANDKVYCTVPKQGGSYCLNGETGEQIWYSRYGGGGGGVNIGILSPAVADGKCYVGGGEYLYCLDAETGGRLWHYRVSPTGHLSCSPAVAYGRVYMTGTTTGTLYCFEDPSIPPIKPSITGPVNGILKLETKFTVNSTDPEGYDVKYYIDWGDNTHTGWIGPYNSGEDIVVKHYWDKLGSYTIRVKARDRDRLESKWSEPHTITIIAAPALKIRTISGGLFKVKSVIENYGSLEATDVNWNITIDGGFILFGRGSSGVVTSIPIGEKRTLNSGFIFGFGDVVIAVSATVSDGLSDTREWMGSVFLFFIKIKYSSSL